MPPPTIHVEPRGQCWVVRRDGDVDLRSRHRDATEATREACEWARRADTTLVLVHDLYARVYAVPIRGYSRRR